MKLLEEAASMGTETGTESESMPIKTVYSCRDTLYWWTEILSGNGLAKGNLVVRAQPSTN
jgi:hypothetical protein